MAILKKHKPPETPVKLTNSLPEYETRLPSYQNAIDLIPGWSTCFPAQYGVTTGGAAPLFEDGRLQWAIAQYGNLADKSVLELGPLEGGHTALLEAAGARVEAVEANRRAFLKCLITKEILGLKNARFHLGDFNAWLEQTEHKYDMIVASGVLYHMIEPLYLLDLLSQHTDALYIWTMFKVTNDLATRVIPFHGVDVRLYLVPYGEKTNAFCGGPNDHSFWIDRGDLIAALGALGYTELKIEHSAESEFGLSASFFARRPAKPAA